MLKPMASAIIATAAAASLMLAAPAQASPASDTTIRQIPIQAQMRMKCTQLDYDSCRVQMRWRLVYHAGTDAQTASAWTRWKRVDILPPGTWGI